MSQNDQIRRAVQERYGAIARSLNVVQPNAASCCSKTPASDQAAADCGCSSKLYDDTLLEGLTEDVTNLSLGCGDPITIASLKPGETALDLGSGGGIDCFMAAKQVGASGHVIGVDMTPDMLAKANASKARMGVTNVEFREGHIEALPVDDDSIDVIMSNCVINLSPDKLAVFCEAFRVLKPGGRISISDIVTEGEFSAEQRAEMDQWAACVTGAVDVDVYTGMMREAGFVDIEVVDKADAEEIVGHTPGMPRVYSARITARKLA